MNLACPECGASVEVTSSFANCPACDADVASHYTPADMSRVFYQRALEQYSMGNELAALEGIRQSVAVVDASELHLLAALIYRKRGEFSDMRHHVAAIPADDILRREGEWLLRSHQERLQQGRLEEARKREQAPVKGGQLVVGKASRQVNSEHYYPVPLDKQPPPKARRSRLPWAIPIAAALLGAIFLTQGTADSVLTALRQLRDIPQELSSAYSALIQDDPAPESRAAIDSAENVTLRATVGPDTATPAPTEAPQEEPAAFPLPEPTQLPSPSPTPTDSEMNSAAVAATIVATAREQSFDLRAYLNGQNRPDLAALAVTAWLQNGELTLQGIVSLTSDRIELLDLAAQIEGVELIHGAALVVQLPETYIVQKGENLRIIAYKLYGDSGRWADLYIANQAIIGEDENKIWVDLELTVP